MREYVRPGYAEEKAKRQLAKLDAVLQALHNCHNTLNTVNGDEAAFLAQEDIASAFQHVSALRRIKTQGMALPDTSMHSPVIDVDLDPEEEE